MYTVYTSTSLSLQPKPPFPHHRLLPPPDDDDGDEDCYFSAAPLLPAISATPRLLYRCYFLRQSSLLRGSPARALLPSLCRGLRGRGGEASLSLCSRVVRRRRCSCCCYGEEGAFRVAQDGGELSDVLGLLAGFEYDRCGGRAPSYDGGGSSRESISSEEDTTESTSSSSSYRGRVTSDVYVSDANRARRGRDWKKGSFSGNLSEDVEALHGRKGRRGRASSFSNSSSHHGKRGEHVQEEGSWWSREEREQQLVSKKDERKVSRVSQVTEESGKEEKASGYNVEASTLTASLLEEIKRQHVEIEQLRKSYKELLERRSEKQESGLARASVSAKASSRVEEQEEISASVATLVEELKKQRAEIDQLRRSYQEIVTSSEVHVQDSERISRLNNVFVSRLRDREENSTTVVNLMDKERDRANFEEQLRRERHQSIEKSTVIEENDSQKVSSLDRISLSRMKETGECSTSDVVEKKREELSYADQYKKAYDELMKSSKASQKFDSGRTASRTALPVSKEDRKESSSSSGANALEERRQQKSHSEQQKETNLKLEILTKTQKLESGNASNQNEVSLSWSGGNQSSSSALNLIEEMENKKNYAAQLKINDQNLTKSSEIHKIDFNRESSLRNFSVLLSKGKEMSSVSDKYVADERVEQQSHKDQIRKDTSKLTRATEIYDSDKRKLTRASEIHDTDNRRLTRASEIHDTDNRKLTRAPEIHDTDSRKLTRASEIHVMDTIELSGSKSSKEVGSTSAVNLVESSSRSESYAYEPDKDNTRLMKSSLERMSHSVSGDLEEIVTSSVEGQDQEVHTEKFGRVGRGSSSLKLSEISAVQDSLIYSHKRSGLRVKEQGESSLKLVQEEKSKEKANILTESSSSGEIASTASFGRNLETGNTEELEEQARRDDFNQVRIDSLESAGRLNESSSLYVDEFMDKIRDKISFLPEFDVVPKSSSPVEIENAKNVADKTSSSGSVSDNSEKNKSEMYVEGPRPSQSSAFSEGRRGPSDEMWDVAGPSNETHAQSDEVDPDVAAQSTSAPTGSERAIIRRSSKSLWGYIADIIRMGWISRAVSRRSSPKSGTKTSSNESASSETWFSGRDADEDDDNEHGKKRRGAHDTVLIKRPIDEKPSTSQVSGVTSEATTFENKLTLTSEEGSVLLTTGGDNKIFAGYLLAEGGTVEHGSTSSVVAAVLPSATADIAPAPNFILGADITEMVEKSKMDVTESETQGQKLAEVGDIEIKDGDLRRRKLQRKKQALKEQFDEWEEAYKLESEQRKTDEFFMREALGEAKKAADSWEVPIGAVLVQNGTVIARGSNLVEELRDSTAHAEIICIREASNLLRTWRLSETTLYVTLEPCAMCAGAILQSRIDTVVWGAPNKLLGADGSWVRLFPGGNDGKDDLGQSSQPAGPIHPFHPKINVRRGILATECSEVMQQFFQLRRKKEKKKKEEQPHQSHMSISNLQNKLISKMHNMFCTMFCL